MAELVEQDQQREAEDDDEPGQGRNSPSDGPGRYQTGRWPQPVQALRESTLCGSILRARSSHIVTT